MKTSPPPSTTRLPKKRRSAISSEVPPSPKQNLCYLKIAEVVVPQGRLRKDLGSLKSLMRSLEKAGSIQPITVDENNVLIAGERRFTAMKALGWKKVPAVRKSGLTHEQKRLLELEENLHRRSFTKLERLKAVVEYHRLRCEQYGQSKGGRPATQKHKPEPTAWSHAKTGEILGLSAKYVQKLVTTAAAIEQFPILEKVYEKFGWEVALDAFADLRNDPQATTSHIVTLLLTKETDEDLIRNPHMIRDAIPSLMQQAVETEEDMAEKLVKLMTHERSINNLVRQWEHLQQAFANLWKITPESLKAQILTLFEKNPLLRECMGCRHFLKESPVAINGYDQKPRKSHKQIALVVGA